MKQKERLFLTEIERFLSMRRKKREFDLVMWLGRNTVDAPKGLQRLPSGEGGEGFLEEINERAMIVSLAPWREPHMMN